MAFMKKVFDGYNKRLSVLDKSSNPLSKGIAYVEGQLVPLSEARIPMVDEGFMHGDLTYDVPSVWDGRFFRLDDHLERLSKSCTKMRMQFPIPREEIKRILVEMTVRSGIRDAFVELIVTRGVKGVRDSVIRKVRPETLQNNLYMFIVPYIWCMSPDMQLTGGDAIIARTVRRTPVGSFDPTIKNLQWGDLTRGMLEAIDRGASFPFLTDGDANLGEGAGFNIVLIKENVLYTADRGVLEGVTRKSVIEVAKANGYEVRLEVVPTELAYRSDEIFMCTTAGGVMPITTLDGQPVKDGKIGPITKRTWDDYWKMHYDDKYSFEIDYSGFEQPRARL